MTENKKFSKVQLLRYSMVQIINISTALIYTLDKMPRSVFISCFNMDGN